jgi:hypothetical protein
MRDVRELVQAYYDCVNAAQWEKWLELFSDDVSGDEQLAGHFAGVDVLRGAVEAIASGYKTFRMIPQRIVVDGDAACVIWRCEATNRNGVPICYRDPQSKKPLPRQVIGANYFQTQAGKIVYLRTVHDSEPFRPYTHPEDFPT